MGRNQRIWGLIGFFSVHYWLDNLINQVKVVLVLPAPLRGCGDVEDEQGHHV